MEKLIHDAQTLFNVHLTGRAVLALSTYEKELMSWNQKFNLTAIRDVEGIRVNVFLKIVFLRPRLESQPTPHALH